MEKKDIIILNSKDISTKYVIIVETTKHYNNITKCILKYYEQVWNIFDKTGITL